MVPHRTMYRLEELRETAVLPVELIKVTGDKHFRGSMVPFGPGSFYENSHQMYRNYVHPRTGAKISFREPTTAESILIAEYNFNERVMPLISEHNWVQLGLIVKWDDGLYINPQESMQPGRITPIDEPILRSLRDKAKPLEGGIRIGAHDFVFVPYGSFSQGIQEPEDFIQGGLARGLSHMREVPHDLGSIFSKTNYPQGVNVKGFDATKTLHLKVASLSSIHSSEGEQLVISGDWGRDDRNGYVFGIVAEKPKK